MAKICSEIENGLLIATVTGNLTAKELIAVVIEYYRTGTVKNVIWDITNGSLQAIPLDDFKAIALAAKAAGELGLRQGGKTVFVVSDDSEYKIAHIYTVIAEVTGVFSKYNVFKSIEEARDWINQH